MRYNTEASGRVFEAAAAAVLVKNRRKQSTMYTVCRVLLCGVKARYGARSALTLLMRLREFSDERPGAATPRVAAGAEKLRKSDL